MFVPTMRCLGLVAVLAAVLAETGCLNAAKEGTGTHPPVVPTVVVQPAGLDFGSVIVHSTLTAAVSVTNASGSALSATIGALQGPDAAFFTINPPAGSVLNLVDKEVSSLKVTYAPLVAASTPSQASFSLQICTNGSAGCTLTVSLQGLAVAPALTAMPSPLDFGFVLSQSSATRTVTLTNVSAQTIHLTANPAVVTTKPDGTAVVPGVFSLSGAPAGGTAIPPGTSLPIAVVFSPTTTTKYLGELDVVSDDPVTPGTKVQLTGSGGGPSISCTPTSLDFGLTAVGIPNTLSVHCTNTGQSVPGHPEANLFIPDPLTQDKGLTILNGDPAFQPAFDTPIPTVGLAAGEGVDIGVTYWPTASGQDSDWLVIASNDPVNPHTKIMLTGTSLALPPCSFQVLPAAGVAFGQVASGRAAVLPFDIVNTGTGACLVDTIQVAGDAAFSLPDYLGSANSAPQIVSAGARLEVNVQFAPTATSPSFVGQATFRISNPANPHQSVSLSGSSLDGCLVVRPSAVDFGTLGVDATGQFCSSVPQTFQVYNLCTLPVRVSSLQVIDPISPSPFSLTAGALPYTIPGTCLPPDPCVPSAPLTFQVTLRPSQVGSHTAGISITAEDIAEPYLVPLRGGAQQNQSQTDSFTGYPASLDVLWVLDSNGSVTNTDVRDHIQGFLALADQEEIDFHMSTTSTDLYGGPSSEDGRMEPCPGCKVNGSPLEVVTDATGPTGATVLLQPLLNLGGWSCMGDPNPNNLPCSGQLFETVAEAFSPALLGSMGYNQPFYRPNAWLAVIFVVNDGSDDQSASHDLATYYSSFLSLKGLQNSDRIWLNRLSYGGSSGSNQRLSLMTQVTGGTEEVSLPDVGWVSTFGTQFWADANARIRSYPLSSTPSVSTIQVLDNMATVQPALWFYDQARRAILFDPLGFPQPGDKVQISYTLGCGN